MSSLMSPFSPSTWPFSIEMLPKDACVVGGSVRDRLLNRQASYLDLDFVLPENTLKIASAIARTCNAGFVVLDSERQIARVVFDQVTVDFAQQQGSSLEADLRRRDFTINAIAYCPTTQTLIDPLNGQVDIATKIIRMVSAQNLSADPLRLMRAYRQAAQLGFTLAPDTQTAIGQVAPQLQTVSVERIRSELDALLCTTGGVKQLAPILESQLLQFCLPHFTATSIEQVAAIDQALDTFQQQMPDYAELLHSWPKPVPAGSYLSWIKITKLSRLLCADPVIARDQLKRLKYSNRESQAVLTLLKIQVEIEAMREGELGRSQQFFLFKSVGESFLAVSLLALSQGVSLSVLKPMILRFLDSQDEIAHSRTLITGNVLMKQFGIKPGPEVGKWLKAVERSQAEGVVRSTEEAISWLKEHL